MHVLRHAGSILASLHREIQEDRSRKRRLPDICSHSRRVRPLNDLNKRKCFSGKRYRKANSRPFDKWFDDNFVCVVNIEGFVDCIVIFFFCVADVYTDTRSVRAWFYNQWKIVTKLVQRGIFCLRCQGSSSWSRNTSLVLKICFVTSVCSWTAVHPREFGPVYFDSQVVECCLEFSVFTDGTVKCHECDISHLAEFNNIWSDFGR